MCCVGGPHEVGPHDPIQLHIWEQGTAEAGGLPLHLPAGGEGGAAGKEAAYQGTSTGPNIITV